MVIRPGRRLLWAMPHVAQSGCTGRRTGSPAVSIPARSEPGVPAAQMPDEWPLAGFHRILASAQYLIASHGAMGCAGPRPGTPHLRAALTLRVRMPQSGPGRFRAAARLADAAQPTPRTVNTPVTTAVDRAEAPGPPQPAPARPGPAVLPVTCIPVARPRYDRAEIPPARDQHAPRAPTAQRTPRSISTFRARRPSMPLLDDRPPP